MDSGGNRRSGTLRTIVHTVWSVQSWLGSKNVFKLTEDSFLDLLLDRADEPCAKSVPRKLLRVLNQVWAKAELPPILGQLAKGQVKRLEGILAEGRLRSVRKALTPCLCVVVSMELAVAEPECFTGFVGL